MIKRKPFGGIYCLKNIHTGECYIGRSIDVQRRVRDHLRNLKNGNHDNRALQANYDAGGPASFTFEYLDFAPEGLDELEEYNWLTVREAFFVDLFRATLNRIASTMPCLDTVQCESAKAPGEPPQPYVVRLESGDEGNSAFSLSTSEAAVKAGVTRSRILKLIKAGLLASEKRGRDHFIALADLAKITFHGRAGRPRKNLT